MDIINVIYMRLVGIEHHENSKVVVTQINSPHNPILRIATYHNW